MNGKKAKKLRKEVNAQYADQEAIVRARIIQAIAEMPLWRRIVVGWRIVDKSPLLCEVHLWAWDKAKNAWRNIEVSLGRRSAA